MMKKNAREEKWNQTAKSISKEKQKINDSDISNLNDDNSFVPITEEEKEPLSESEKLEIRKKLFILLIVIIVVILFMIINLIFDPFNNKSNNDKKDNSNQEEQLNDEENDTENNDDNKSDEQDLNKKLFDLPDGEININNLELKNLISEITYKNEEYYDDTLFLYIKDNIKINDISDNNKLFLATKTKQFNDIVNSKISNNDICNSNITITKEELNKILKDKFNTTISTYNSYNYKYYVNGEFNNNITFTLNGDQYIGKCNNNNSEIINIAEQSLVSASKKENNIYIDFKIAFINKTGVFKDSNFKDLITNDGNETSDSYMLKANTYRYVYNINGNNYYLTEVQLLK